MDDALTYDRLFAGAQKFAQLALQAHRDGDEEVFVLHAGVSFERLMKAALSQANPMLLMESAKHSDALLLRFAGITPSKSHKDDDRLRTISASDALKRARAAGWLSQHKELDDLIELRNGVAHLGHTPSESNDILAIFARSTNSLLDHLHEDQFEYWADWSRTIEISINERLAKDEKEVKRRIEQAKHRYQQLIDSLPGKAPETLRLESYVVPKSMELSARRVGLVVGRAMCPACTNGCLVVFKRDLIGAGEPEEREASVVLLYCRACALQLKGATELAAAEVDLSEVDLPDLEPEVFEDVLTHLALAEPDATFKDLPFLYEGPVPDVDSP
ncbi:hypothetical protein J7E91_16555 [Streptomyces sp. ISL-99]|uniref:hypothetical protein n=1 Tax=Streptomyces sp. ISL-99 TaxID=2819193 RepID=UPI001BEC854A|nr:hypothetical protein [Streptomyces sp. ISL-99]MBT2526990.1 hypothetical protein [Streptomyces sp. ISL-99]